MVSELRARTGSG